jgi:hypothetical protein
MSGVNKTINVDGMKVLRSIVDEAIVSLEAVIVARDNVAWGVVRLNTTSGPVEVRNRIEELPINDEGETDEFGVLSVMVTNGAFVVDDVDQEASVCPLDETVTGITLINGRVVTYEDGEAIADRSYTQAIVFELASGEYLVLDKGAWFSEMISINMGPSPSVFISDDSEDWEDDPEEPSIHYGWERAFVRV